MAIGKIKCGFEEGVRFIPERRMYHAYESFMYFVLQTAHLIAHNEESLGYTGKVSEQVESLEKCSKPFSTFPGNKDGRKACQYFEYGSERCTIYVHSELLTLRLLP